MKGGFGDAGDNSGMQMFLALLGLAVVAVVFYVLTKKEGFVPMFPSAEGDKKVVTPAGNVILY